MTEFYKQLNMLCRDILQKAPPPRWQNQDCHLRCLWLWQKHSWGEDKKIRLWRLQALSNRRH